MKKNPQVSVDTISVILFEQHFAQAIDELREVLSLPEVETHNDYLMEWRLSSSCVVHCLSSIDSLVNGIGFDYFFNKDTEQFIPLENRSFSLMRTLRSWDNLSLLERLMVIIEVAGLKPLPPKLENEIREMNDLRNWIIHGKPFTLTTLREFYHDEENFFRMEVHDWEESINWNKKYPNTKFNSPSQLDRQDAKNSFRIAVMTNLFILKQIKWFHTVINTFYGEISEYRIDEKTTIEDVMNRYQID